jgi:hypothetical protein
MKINLKAKIPLFVYIIIFILILLAGILNVYLRNVNDYKENKELAINECIKECELFVLKGNIVTDGPCISQEIIKNWACDIVNQPKIKLIDSNPKNQCESYNKNKVKYLVEVTKNCELISAK